MEWSLSWADYLQAAARVQAAMQAAMQAALAYQATSALGLLSICLPHWSAFPVVIALYRLLLSLAAPILIGALLLRVLKGRETWEDFKQRLGHGRGPFDGPVLWVHGASNGELTAARMLLERLAARFPDLRICVSCNTTSAREMVQGWQMAHVHAQLAPLDLRWCLNRFLAAHKPQAFVLLEADFWPNKQLILSRSGIPAVLVEGRMSRKSAAMWTRFSGLSRPVFDSFSKIWPQSRAAQTRLCALGIAPERFGAVLDLKARYNAKAMQPHPGFERARTWLAASTHDGEDEIILDAHQIALKTHRDLHLILAPRHPKRGNAIAAMITARGFEVARRSRDQAPEGSVYLADTLGEMPLWYVSCFACFVAGSLVPKGGHTPFEPIAHGAAVIHGPHTDNFADIYDALNTAQAAHQVSDAQSLACAVLDLARPGAAQAAAERATKAANTSQNGNHDTHEIEQALENLAFASRCSSVLEK